MGAGFQSIDDADLALYTGPTIIAGKRDKFMVSAGVSYHRVKRLNEEFVLDTSYPVDEVSVADLTRTLIKPSFFISLSYAIATRRTN